MKKRLVLLTGAGGDAQGWGDMHVTESVCAAAVANGFDCRVVTAESEQELESALRKYPVDLVWSSLYFFSNHSDIVGVPADAVWIADLLEKWNIAYVGPSAETMKNLIGKFTTHEILAKAGIPVPCHMLFPPQSPDALDFYPAFVKPNGESRSVGISDQSVVLNSDELRRRIAFLNQSFDGQSALAEEYLPGREYTVLVVGNGNAREILPGRVTVDPERYGKYPILRSDLRGIGITRISRPEDHFEEAVDLAERACTALRCRDHVRIDMREAADGKLRIMEVNGIPGLKPLKSWSPQLFALYHPEVEPYQGLIGAILNAAGQPRLPGNKF